MFGVTETVSYGVLTYAFAVLLVPIQEETGWSAAAITGAYSAALLVSGLVGLQVGRVLDRRSPRLLMTAGSVLAAALMLAWSRVGTLLELYLVFAGLGVAMALVLYEPAFVVVTKWFRLRRNAALTTLTLIAAVSSFIFSPLTERLVAAHGWRDAVAVLAAVLAATTIPLHAIVLRPAPLRDGPIRTVSEPGRAAVVRRGGFWLITAAFALSSFVSVAVAVHLVKLLVDGGTTPAFAAFAAGLMGLSQIPGRVVFALAASRLGPAATASSVFAFGAVALVSLTVDQSRWAVLAFVGGYGMSNGMTTLLRATVIADLYGQASFGAISGVVSAVTLAVRAAAPFVAALIALAQAAPRRSSRLSRRCPLRPRSRSGGVRVLTRSLSLPRRRHRRREREQVVTILGTAIASAAAVEYGVPRRVPAVSRGPNVGRSGSDPASPGTSEGLVGASRSSSGFPSELVRRERSDFLIVLRHDVSQLATARSPLRRLPIQGPSRFRATEEAFVDDS
jgi:MFS family permease